MQEDENKFTYGMSYVFHGINFNDINSHRQHKLLEH